MKYFNRKIFTLSLLGSITLFSASTLPATNSNAWRPELAQAIEKRNFAQAYELSQSADNLPEPERKELYFTYSNIIHFCPASEYEKIENTALKIINLPSSTPAEKLRAYNIAADSLRRRKMFDRLPAIFDRMLALEIPLLEKAKINSEAGSIYLHVLGNREKSKVYFSAAVACYQELSGSLSGEAQVEALMNCARICSSQLNDRAQTDVFAQKVQEFYDRGIAQSQGQPRAELQFKLANFFKDVNNQTAAKQYWVSAFNDMQQYLESIKNLPDEEFLKKIDAQFLIYKFSDQPEGCAAALALADRMLKMPPTQLKADLRANILNRADWICRWGGKLKLIHQLPKYLQQQIDLSSTAAGKSSLQIRLGEYYVNNGHNLQKARQIFQTIAATPDNPEKNRNTAKLFLELLQDK